MPLYDHFHGPLAWRPWEAFHARWACAIADDLNSRLPKRLVAEAPMRLGAKVSADIGEYERLSRTVTSHSTNGSGHDATGGVAVLAEPATGGVAVLAEPATDVLTETYAPPETEFVMPAAFPTEIKVEIRDRGAAYKLLAVVELVSPANKKEEDEREQFAAKCLSYLGKGLGLVVIDVVTTRHKNLHNELVRLAGHDDKFLMPDDQWIYVTAYRPVSRKREDLIDLWQWPLRIGAALPAVPLALKGYGCVRLDLEATYAEACVRLRIPE